MHSKVFYVDLGLCLWFSVAVRLNYCSLIHRLVAVF